MRIGNYLTSLMLLTLSATAYAENYSPLLVNQTQYKVEITCWEKLFSHTGPRAKIELLPEKESGNIPQTIVISADYAPLSGIMCEAATIDGTHKAKFDMPKPYYKNKQGCYMVKMSPSYNPDGQSTGEVFSLDKCW